MRISSAVGACALALSAFAASTAGATDPAPAAKANSNQCFWARSVESFAAPDSHTVNIRVGLHDIYQFKMLGPCNDVNWSDRIALVTRGGSDFICTGMDADIVTHSVTGPQRCAVRSLKKLTPEEIAALGKHAQP
jgi:hypothetical protein